MKLGQGANRLVDVLATPAGKVVIWAANSWKVVVGLYAGAILGGAAIFDLAEAGRTYWDGIWWAFITCLTIGYGDVYPTTIVGRVTGILLAHLVILLVVPMIIAQITLRLIVDNDEFTHAEQEAFKEALADQGRKLDLVLEHLGIEAGASSADRQP